MAEDTPPLLIKKCIKNFLLVFSVRYEAQAAVSEQFSQVCLVHLFFPVTG